MGNIRSLLAVALLLPVISILACNPGSPDGPVADEAAVRAQIENRFDALVEAVKSLDTDRYFSFFDQARFSGLAGDGTTWHSFEEFASIMRPAFESVTAFERLEFSRVKITVLDSTTAILVNEFQDEIALQGGDLMRDAGGGVQVWKLTDGEWLVASVASVASELVDEGDNP